MPLLRYTVDETGALSITSSRRRCITLVLRSSAAEVRAGTSCAVLSWDANGEIPWLPNGTEPDRWTITYWAPGGRGGPYGIAVRVTGHLASASHGVVAATTSRWRRMCTWDNRGPHAGSVLPLYTGGALRSAYSREMTTLQVLTRVLASRPDLRPKLADPSRMSRLANDLASRRKFAPTPRAGARRDTIDIGVAMRNAGYVHPYGRPLAVAALPQIDEVVARTRKCLDANPYRRGRVVSDDLIRRVVQHTYFDVEPWPFAALVD